MVAQIVSFFQRAPRRASALQDWAQQELAEFYRVESALTRAGIRVCTDRGLSDEGEPWFVFYRADDGEVVIHFARIDGEYIIVGPAYEKIARGLDFSALVKNMIARHPLVRPGDRKDNIALHPAALLIAIVGTAFFKSGEARAGESNRHDPRRGGYLLTSPSKELAAGAAIRPADTVQIPANEAVLVLAAALLSSGYSANAAEVETSTRQAIAAGAGALDFTGFFGSRPQMSAGDNGLFHQEPVAIAFATEHMSSTLSLMAILSTLPAPNDGSIDVAPADAGRLGDAAMIDLLPYPSALAHDQHWAIDVRLVAGGLPSVAAVELVRSAVGNLADKTISVIQLTSLPNVLADLIHHGEHIFVGNPPAPPPATAEPDSPAVDPIVDITPIHPIVPTTPDSAPSYAPPELVKKFIEYFVNHTPDVELVVQGSELIFVDNRLFHDVSSIDQLTTVTFDFADGSSISLIGAHSAFYHYDLGQF